MLSSLPSTNQTSAKSFSQVHTCSALQLAWIAIVLLLALNAHATPTLRDVDFAQRQIRQFSDFERDLNRRAAAASISHEAPVAKLAPAIRDLDTHLTEAQHSLVELTNVIAAPPIQSPDDVPMQEFRRESLRADILALQESAQRALNVVIDSDAAATSSEKARVMISQ